MRRPRPLRNRRGVLLWFALAAAPAGAWLLLKHLNRDFWYDELYTLLQFVFVPFRVSATSYPAANNHILFSLIANAYTRLVGVRSLDAALSAPWRLRLLCALPAAGAAAYVYLIARRGLRLANPWTAPLLLLTTIPFSNFALQFRGYVWSFFFLSGMLYHLWRDEARPGAQGLVAAAFAAAALYAIPLNLYFLAALMLVYAGEALWSAPRTAARARRALLLLAAGALVGAALYLPVLPQLLSNPVVQSAGPFRFDTLTRVLPLTALYLASERWLLLPAAAAGFAAGPRLLPGVRRRVQRLGWLLVLPFLLSFARGDRPFLRVFVNLAPVFALALAAGVDRLLEASRRRRVFPLAAVGLAFYCYACFAAGQWRIAARLRSDLAAGRKSQDIYFNYYQAWYHPRRTAARLAAALRRAPAPVVCAYPGDKLAAAAYLAFQRLPYAGRDALPRALRAAGRAYVFTAFPRRFLRELRSEYPGVAAQPLTREASFFNAFLLRRR